MLKIGDRLESIKGTGRYKCWGIAIITFINQDTLELQFENDSDMYNRSVYRFSPEIAQIGKNFREYGWKHELRIGDEVDGFDKAKVWYPSTILGFKNHTESNGRSLPLVYVGFRVFTPDGVKKDKDGNRFNGWSYRFDEWVPLWSLKIAKLHHYTWPRYYKGLKGAKVLIDDNNDPKVKENENQAYAVLRPKLNSSSLLIECLNLFGSEGGYDKILDLILSKNFIGFDLIDRLLMLFDKPFCMFHRDFIRKFAPALKNAIEGMILKMSSISHKDGSRRNIDNIICSLINLLKRVNPIDKVQNEIERLKMNFINLLVKSNDDI